MPVSSSPPVWAPLANAVNAQFASRPTLESVTRYILAGAITEKYPSLSVDLTRVRLATPREGGGWELTLLMPLVLNYLANSVALDLRPRHGKNCFLSDETGNWLEPAQGSLDMQVIDSLIKELSWSVPIGLQNALSDYWAANADTGVSRWRWLSNVLKDTLSISALEQDNLSNLARETLNQVIQCPEHEERVSRYGEDSTHVYCLQSTLGSGKTISIQLSTTLVLVRSELVLSCRPDGRVKIFSSLDAVIEHEGLRLSTRFSADEIRIKRYELDGNIFDAQAGLILNLQLARLAALKLPANVGLDVLQAICNELTNPAQYVLGAPSPDHQALDAINIHLPDWLQHASAGDQALYRQYSLTLASAKKNSQGRTFLSDIADIRSFTVDALQQQMRLDQAHFELDAPDDPAREALHPDDVELSFLVVAGFPGTSGITETIEMSLTDLALKNLSGKPQGSLTLRHRSGSALPSWLTPDYITRRNGLIEQVDIGRTYPQKIQSLLLSDTPDALKREQLFAEQLSVQLPLQALELSLKKENGFTSLGSRYVAALMLRNPVHRQVNNQHVVIRPLALMRKSGARPDLVNNMYVIESADMSVGPHVLYRPLYAHSLYQFSTRAALLEAIAAPGALQDSVLVWLSDAARPIYDNGGFQEPHYVRFGQGSDTSILEVPQPAILSTDGASDELLQYLHNGKLMQFLYSGNARALVDQADRDSVSNSESRWNVFLEGGSLLFNTLMLPLLRGPAMVSAWLWMLAGALNKDIPALNSKDPTARDLAVVDMLLNLGMLLFQMAPSSPPQRSLHSKVKAQVVRTRLPVRIAKQWPEPPLSKIVAGAVTLAGEVPGADSTAVDFSFASAQNRLTASQRARLRRFEVLRTEPLPAPIAHAPNKGLYVIDGQWHAVVEGNVYKVRLEPEGVVIIDPAGSSQHGPYLKTDSDGHWSLDLRLRLFGGMPLKRMEAVRERKAQRVRELQTELDQFLAQENTAQNRIEVVGNILAGTTGDPKYTEAQRATYREKLYGLLQDQTDSYLKMLESNKERTELQVPLSSKSLATLMENIVNNARKTVVLTGLVREAVPAKWPQFQVPSGMLGDAILADPLGHKQFIKDLVEVNERSIYWLELKETYLNKLYNLGPVGVEVFTRLTSNRPANEINVLSIKDLQLKCLKLPSIKELTLGLIDSLDAVIDPLQEHVRTHAELNNLEFSRSERLEVLDSLVEHYGLALDALQGLKIIHAEEYDEAYFDKLFALIEGMYADVTEQLASEIKPPAQQVLTSPKSSRTQPGKPKKQIIKTRHSGQLIGELKPSNEELPLDVVEVRSEFDNLLLATYSQHGEEWDAVEVVKPGQQPQATRALAAIKGDAHKLVSKVDIHLKRADSYMKTTRYPEDIEHVLESEARSLYKLADELERAIQGQPDTSQQASAQKLMDDMRSNALQLKERGKALRTQLSLSLPPTHGNLQYLLNEKLVQIARLGERVPLRGERQDFIQEYAINNLQGYPLWYAHFHYPAATTPKLEYSVAHMKTKEQRKQSYYSLLAKAQGRQAIVDVHRGAIGKKLAERWFLPLAP